VEVARVTVRSQVHDALEKLTFNDLCHVVRFADLYDIVMLDGGGCRSWGICRHHGNSFNLNVDLLSINKYAGLYSLIEYSQVFFSSFSPLTDDLII